MTLLCVLNPAKQLMQDYNWLMTDKTEDLGIKPIQDLTLG